MRFASLLVYTPWRRDPKNQGPEPRRIMGMVKGARPEVVERVAVRCSELRDADFADFFTPASTLVPVPPSAPARTPDTLWPGLSIAEALLRQGLGRDLQKLLVRTVRVPKAHEQSATDRPRIDELVDSLEWQGDFGSDLEEIILVDDVVTRGTTFLAARTVIQQVDPWVDVKGFAAVRTMSFNVVTEPLSPATGVVELGSSGWGYRDP